MHPFSGRVCHQNEGEKQERGKPGRNQEGEAPAQEGGEENQQDDSSGSPGRTVVEEPKRTTSLGWKKDVKGPRKEVFRL